MNIQSIFSQENENKKSEKEKRTEEKEMKNSFTEFL